MKWVALIFIIIMILALSGSCVSWVVKVNQMHDQDICNVAKSYAGTKWEVTKTDTRVDSFGDPRGVNVTITNLEYAEVITFKVPTNHKYVLGKNFVWRLQEKPKGGWFKEILSAGTIGHFTEVLTPEYSL